MSDTEYIRSAANKYGWKKYYSVMRPVSIGTAPKSGMMGLLTMMIERKYGRIKAL